MTSTPRSLMINQDQKPSWITLEALFTSITHTSVRYASHFGWMGERPARVSRRTLMAWSKTYPSMTSADVKEGLDKFHQELLAALPHAVRYGDDIEVGTAMHHLCFLSSLVLQPTLLAKIIGLPAKSRPVLGALEARLCVELVTLWKHCPWYVQSINDAQPVLEFPVAKLEELFEDLRTLEEKEDDKSVSRSLLKPSA